MKLGFTAEQQELSAELDRLLAAAELPAVIRAWGAGDADGVTRVWSALAEMGLMGLLVPEAEGGAGADILDVLAVAVQLGRHAVPGPWIEHAVYLPTLLSDSATLPSGLAWESLAMGEPVVTCNVVGAVPRALDADLAEIVLSVSGGNVRPATAVRQLRSIDASRHLFEVEPRSGDVQVDASAQARAFEVAALAQTAQLLGLAERMLELTVTYVSSRQQFGKTIGQYQAIAHRAADARIAIDFARPLLWGGADAVRRGRGDVSRAVSAAKVRAAAAARVAADAALQLHGAIGYTEEYDLSLYWLRAEALAPSWGTVEEHRRRIMKSLESNEEPLWSLN